VSASVLHMSMSLDGFVAGPNEGPDNPMGDGGYRLHQWFLPSADADHKHAGRLEGNNGQAFGELLANGAVVTGRRTFQLADGWGGDHHDGVPILVVTRREPDPAAAWPLVTYVADIGAAMTQAKQAAGDKHVLVHGARTAQLALAAGVLDELELHLVPVLLGQGRRLLDGPGPGPVELERTRVLQGEAGVTHLHYRVQR
jgi:dihydrofolate reductase